MRERSRSRQTQEFFNSNSPAYSSQIVEYMSEAPVGGGNRLRHWRITPHTGNVWSGDHPTYGPGSSYFYDGYDSGRGSMSYILTDPIVQNAIRRSEYLDWSKLPSSSSFGIIQFFAELDDTLAMFTKRFLRKLSYGSVTWGVLPFIQDLRALAATLNNLSTD
jgi:hypothetical protein